MIVLDTSVLSELWKAVPDTNVLTWINAQAMETLYLSTMSVAALRFDLASIPESKRRSVYQMHLEADILPPFSGRILSFDLEAAQAYADLMTTAKAGGHDLGHTDGYIAAIAVAHGFAVATHDTAPFEAVGLRTINPWRDSFIMEDAALLLAS